MSQKDSGNRKGLSGLRGKTSNQSVPIISFKFNPSSENLTEVSDSEEHTAPFSIPSTKSSKDSIYSSPEESSSKSSNRFLGQRSTSLDSKDGSADMPSPKGSETPGLLSRFTKTVEHKINEIRAERQKDTKSTADVDISRSSEKISGQSPSKNKSSATSDLTDHRNKFKSEMNSFRPKFSELRNRKSGKDQANKSRSSVFNPFWSREDGFVPEELLDKYDNIEPAMEAQTATECFPVNESPVTPEPLPVLQTTKTEALSFFSRMTSAILHNINVLLSWNFKFLAVFILVSYFLSVPHLIVGFVFGALFCWYLFSYIRENDLWDVVFPPKYEDCVPPDPPEVELPPCEEFYKGWMNKLEEEYCPEAYHVSLTQSVFVRLQGATLQLDYPQKRIGKHARYGEETQSGGFIHNREYDLTGSEVLLLPKNLPRKWLWSRKYPICIHLQKCMPSASTDDLIKPDCATETSLDVTAELLSQPSSDQDEDISNSAVDLDSYEEVTKDMCIEKTLFLFARSDREKDDWFRRFVSASNYNERNVPASAEDIPVTPDQDAMSSTSESDSEGQNEEQEKRKQPLNFERFMSKLLHQNPDSSIIWFNTVVGRILFDFLHNQYWADKIQERIQRKLSKLHIPCFIGEIIVNGVDLGSTVPRVLSIQQPTTNERGIWVNFEATYTGNFTLSLETKLDLMKLKDRSANNSESPDSPVYGKGSYSEYMQRNVDFDTDTDDSVESSSDEEVDEITPSEVASGTSKRFLKIVDTVAASRYFQQAAEWKVSQRAMAGLSNTRIELIVEVKRLAGKMYINIPPPPADRVWYGFQEPPELIMVPRPRVAERAVNVPFLAEFIQKQLRAVFEKVFVYPNMDDLVIPVMSPLLPGQTPLPQPWEVHGVSSPHSQKKTEAEATDKKSSFD